MSEPEPSPIRRASPDADDPAATGTPAVPDGPVRWRVRPAITVLKAVGVAVFVLLGLLDSADRVALVIGLAGAAVLAALVVRDLVAGVRLAADRDGLWVVAGYAGRRRVGWSQVERLRLDRRTRLGVRTELLEIDAGETLYLFSRTELGAPCEDALRTLEALRPSGNATPSAL